MIIFINGSINSGKSTVGQLLAERFNYEFIEFDDIRHTIPEPNIDKALPLVFEKGIKILNELDKKMDDKGNLFLRFDKQKAYLDELKITEHGDSIHLKIKIAAYPAKKKPALKIAREMWGE